jgi:hypothetical protein
MAAAMLFADATAGDSCSIEPLSNIGAPQAESAHKRTATRKRVKNWEKQKVLIPACSFLGDCFFPRLKGKKDSLKANGVELMIL